MSDPTVIAAQVIGGAYAVWVAVGSVPELRTVLAERGSMAAAAAKRLWRPVWQRIHLAWSWVKAHALRPFGLDRGVTGSIHATLPAAMGSVSGQGSGRFGWTGIGTGYSSMEGRVALIEEALGEVRSRFDEERQARQLHNQEVRSAMQGLAEQVEVVRVQVQAQAAQSAGRALALLPYAVWAVILTTAPDWLAAVSIPALAVFVLVPPAMTLLGAIVRRVHDMPS